eukprot:TRINITY_DN1982_c0_g1_i1.p1 TRINITY_DN1982_c0_g1~~TRINITY_DN1982_c0_g1_i1.p1  ORF type:complete len:577 (+),score=79.51 TRINITY_DN1982_c0_g1_i1:37-1767(+)
MNFFHSKKAKYELSRDPKSIWFNHVSKKLSSSIDKQLFLSQFDYLNSSFYQKELSEVSKWHDIINKSNNNKKIDKNIIHGIPMELRKTVYWKLSGASKRFVDEPSTIYRKALVNTLGPNYRDISYSTLFSKCTCIPESFKGKYLNCLTSSNWQYQLIRIIVVLNGHNPDLVHSPMLLPILTLLFFLFEEPEIYCLMDSLMSMSRNNHPYSSPKDDDYRISEMETSLDERKGYFLLLDLEDQTLFSESVSYCLLGVNPRLGANWTSQSIFPFPIFQNFINSFCCDQLYLPQIFILLDHFMWFGQVGLVRICTCFFNQKIFLNCKNSLEIGVVFNNFSKHLSENYEEFMKFVIKADKFDIDSLVLKDIEDQLSVGISFWPRTSLASNALNYSTSMKDNMIHKGSIHYPLNDFVIFENFNVSNIWKSVPNRFKTRSIVEVLNSSQDGLSFELFENHCRSLNCPVIIIIETADRMLSGAFLSQEPRFGFFADNRSFLFDHNGEVFKSTGANDFFGSLTNEFLLIGGGVGYSGLLLSFLKRKVCSNHCETFDNVCLFGKDKEGVNIDIRTIVLLALTVDKT